MADSRSMSELQFSLFFAAILIAYVLIHLRLQRFESYLKEVAGLKQLNERLNGVADALERVRLDHVEELLGEMHDTLRGVQEGLQKFERTVHRDLSHTAPASPAAPAPPEAQPAGTAGEQLRAAVETRLLALGYGDIHVLSDLSDTRLDEQYEIRVECTRERMPSKGSVIVRNGSVVDVSLQSASQLFP